MDYITQGILLVFIGIYFVLFATQTLRYLSNFPLLQQHARKLRTFRHLEALDESTLTPLTLILPVSRLSIANVMEWIKLDYPDIEFILVHDQVTPQAMLAWRDRLHLKPTARFPVGDLNTANIQGIFQGEKDTRIWFIDKAPSHLSDTLNTGLNFCQTPLIAMVSAEVYPEANIFKQSARKFLEDKEVWAVSGRIRSHDHPEQAGKQKAQLPTSSWGYFEVVYEQFQHLLQWNRYSHHSNYYELSPLYTVFRRSNLLESGGFTGQYQSFMVDLVRNLKDLSQRRNQRFACTFLPDTLGWKKAAQNKQDMKHFFAYHQQVARRLVGISIPQKAKFNRLNHHFLFPLSFWTALISIVLLSILVTPAYLLGIPMLLIAPLIWALLSVRSGEFVSKRYTKNDITTLFVEIWKYLPYWSLWSMLQMTLGWFKSPQPLIETSRDPLLRPSPLRYTAPLDPESLELYED